MDGLIVNRSRDVMSKRRISVLLFQYDKITRMKQIIFIDGFRFRYKEVVTEYGSFHFSFRGHSGFVSMDFGGFFAKSEVDVAII